MGLGRSLLVVHIIIALHCLLQDIELDGDTGSVEIWIDRDKDGKVNQEVVDTARSFRWTRGPVHVHVHGTHVGIYGRKYGVISGRRIPDDIINIELLV